MSAVDPGLRRDDNLLEWPVSGFFGSPLGYLIILVVEIGVLCGVLLGAGVITLVGALDDRFDLPPLAKLAGQVLAAVIVVHFGVAVKSITLPFIGWFGRPAHALGVFLLHGAARRGEKRPVPGSLTNMLARTYRPINATDLTGRTPCE